MKVSKNSKINFLVKTLICDENILSLKPVIAWDITQVGDSPLYVSDCD